MRRLRFLTGNAGKLAEATRILGPLGFDVVPFAEGERQPTLVEPQAERLQEVAESKLEQAVRLLPEGSEDAVLVEDSGLFVEALGGFPGVYSAYALATLGCEGLLDLLSGVGDRAGAALDELADWERRAAVFRCSARLWVDGRTVRSEGECPGHLATMIDGSGGFGFDPVFVPRDLDGEGTPLPMGARGSVSTHGATFAAVDARLKDAFSHRRRALEGLAAQLRA